MEYRDIGRFFGMFMLWTIADVIYRIVSGSPNNFSLVTSMIGAATWTIVAAIREKREGQK